MIRHLQIFFTRTPYIVNEFDRVALNILKSHCRMGDVYTHYQSFKDKLKEEKVDNIPAEGCIKHVIDEFINVANMGDCQGLEEREVVYALLTVATDSIVEVSQGENESTRLFHKLIVALSKLNVMIE